jgi:hypothetical protein
MKEFRASRSGDLYRSALLAFLFRGNFFLSEIGDS